MTIDNPVDRSQMDVILLRQLAIGGVNAFELSHEVRAGCFGTEFNNTLRSELCQGTEETTSFALFLVGFDLNSLHIGKDTVDGSGDHDLIVVPRGCQNEIAIMDIDVGGVLSCDF